MSILNIHLLFLYLPPKKSLFLCLCFFCNSRKGSVQCWLPSYSTRPKKQTKNPPHITQHRSTCMWTAIMPTCRKERIINSSLFQDTLCCAGTAVCGNDKEELSIYSILHSRQEISYASHISVFLECLLPFLSSSSLLSHVVPSSLQLLSVLAVSVIPQGALREMGREWWWWGVLV